MPALMSAPEPEVQALLSRIYATVNNTYFDKKGRYCHRIPTTFSATETKSLDTAGLTPNTFVAISHDEAIKRLRKAAQSINLKRAADAFVASLTSAGLAWQGVLPATVLGVAMPTHKETPMGGSTPHCRICFYQDEAHDATMHAYFAHVQGAGWGTDSSGPVEAILTLERACQCQNWPQPTQRDIWVFYQVLDLLRKLPPTTRYGKARDALKKAGMLSHNNSYRCETTLEALADIGVIETPEHPGLMTRFTTAAERDRRPNTRVEAPAPLGWWQASDGLNEKLIIRLFGHLKCPSVKPAVAPVAQSKRRKISQSSTPRLPKRLPGPVAAGDVYAIRFREDLWGAAYCHEARTDSNGVTRGRLEYLDILVEAPPTAESITVTSLRFRDRENGERWQAWVGRLDSETGVRRIATKITAPKHSKLKPDRIPYAGAPELRTLASWNFPDL